MHVFGSTVADALAKSGVTIGEHDLVVPAPDQAIEDGSASSCVTGASSP
jgi:uncharacterized protein YabE (DUF348 family)